MSLQSFALLRLRGRQKKVNVKTKARDVSHKQLDTEVSTKPKHCFQAVSWAHSDTHTERLHFVQHYKNAGFSSCLHTDKTASFILLFVPRKQETLVSF